MAELYPALEPYASGSLDVGDGHRVRWETCGHLPHPPRHEAVTCDRCSGAGVVS
jgi:hypothetical protein